MYVFCLHADCTVLINYLGGPKRLHCTDERLDIAYDNPSVFCQMSGKENQYYLW